jgi:signal transduction histidine kinase
MNLRGLDRFNFIAFAVLAGLLIAAGFIIYSKIDQLSASDFENRQRFLSSAMASFRRDFGGILIDLARAFQPSPQLEDTEELKTELAERYRLFVEEDPDSRLIAGLRITVYERDLGVTHYQFNPSTYTFTEAQNVTPPDPASARNPLLRLIRGGARGVMPEPRLHLYDGELLVSIPYFPGRPAFPRFPLSSDRGQGIGPPPLPRVRDQMGSTPLERFGRRWAAVFVVTLDRDYLCDQLFARLVEGYFGGPVLSDFGLRIVSDSGKSLCAHPASDQSLQSSTPPDAAVILASASGRFIEAEPGFDFNRPPASRSRSGLLTLEALHLQGSLAKAVAIKRFYDLALAYGILLLLAASGITLLLNARRARSLANRQMDFVAGISHELRNPLTALQSAGFNLSEGLIHDKHKVESYGRMIRRESRRLNQMVEQVLSYAGFEHNSNNYSWKSVRVEEILKEVLEDYRSLSEEDAWQVETRFDSHLPLIRADRSALHSCFRNLIDNAVKYGQSGNWLAVKATCSVKGGKEQVLVSIEDHGPGISRSELQKIFKPFYRGSKELGSSTPGVGLGLALVMNHVEAHGGELHVDSVLGRGTRFTLTFPSEQASPRRQSNG